MSGRIPVREVIVVEGRYDKNTLLQIFDAAVQTSRTLFDAVCLS